MKQRIRFGSAPATAAGRIFDRILSNPLAWARTLLVRSIRWQITGWYTLLLAGMMVLFSAGTYVAVYRLLIENFDESLASQANLLVNTIGFENGELMITNDSLRIGRVNNEHLIRVYRADGTLIYNDNSIEQANALAASVPLALAGERQHFAIEGREGPMRVLTVPIFDGTRTAGALQLGLSLEDVGDTMRALLKALLILAPGVLLLASCGGFFLASRALGPINRITRAAQQISAENFSRRLDLRGPNDEIGRLAHTFDAMITRLQLAFEQQRRFTADASHELRSPITAIIGQIDVAVERTRDAESYQATLLSVREQAQRLARLTNDLLYLARSDAQPKPVLKEPIDLGQLLPAIVAQLEPLAEARNQTLQIQLPPTLLTHGNEDDLIRLFLNLLDNAIRYTPIGGSIAIETGTHTTNNQPTIHVAIRDTGPGIAPEHLPHLFERFFRVDRGRTRAQGGTGLGLSIAQTIAQAHGGQIQATSTLGQGSTFTVTLPCGSIQTLC
ncbi:MAG: HAMP domain-containing protein [Chloroflexi bacterium SZAS-1]|jgi:heavy metal sensor kinase|nr:HAMP domain-containing protein [Chloroflexi bacterium SZAS-1]